MARVINSFTKKKKFSLSLSCFSCISKEQYRIKNLSFQFPLVSKNP